MKAKAKKCEAFSCDRRHKGRRKYCPDHSGRQTWIRMTC